MRFPLTTDVRIVDSNKVNAHKQHLIDTRESPFLSTNDILTAAFARQTENRTDVLEFVVDCRGKIDGVQKDFAGNFEKLVHMPNKAARDPNQVRACVSKLAHYRRNRLPLMPFVTGRYAMVSNWATLSKFLPMDILAHAPLRTFVNMCPIPMMVIFKVDESTLALIHNHAEPRNVQKGQRPDYKAGDSTLLDSLVIKPSKARVTSSKAMRRSKVRH